MSIVVYLSDQLLLALSLLRCPFTPFSALSRWENAKKYDMRRLLIR